MEIAATENRRRAGLAGPILRRSRAGRLGEDCGLRDGCQTSWLCAYCVKVDVLLCGREVG